MALNRFVSPQPLFIKPTGTDDILKPPPKDNRPAQSIKDQAVNKKIYELLQQAKQLSSTVAKDQADKPKTKEASKTKERKTLTENLPEKKITFCEAHIIESDSEFIKITRTMSIFDKGAHNLLLANGGKKYLDQGLTFAAAWDLLRKERQSNLLKPAGSQFDKRPALNNYKSYVQGMPSQEDLWRKLWQLKVKDEK